MALGGDIISLKIPQDSGGKWVYKDFRRLGKNSSYKKNPNLSNGFGP